MTASIEQETCCKTRMTPVSVSKRADGNQFVMKANCQLIPGKDLVLCLIAHIPAELFQAHRDLLPGNANVGFDTAKLSCPAPDEIEHPLRSYYTRERSIASNCFCRLDRRSVMGSCRRRCAGVRFSGFRRSLQDFRLIFFGESRNECVRQFAKSRSGRQFSESVMPFGREGEIRYEVRQLLRSQICRVCVCDVGKECALNEEQSYPSGRRSFYIHQRSTYLQCP